jgi:hypothetical protein
MPHVIYQLVGCNKVFHAIITLHYCHLLISRLNTNCKVVLLFYMQMSGSCNEYLPQWLKF